MNQERSNFQLQDFFIIFIASALLAAGLQGALLHILPGIMENKAGRLFIGMWPQDLLFLAGVICCVRVRKESWSQLGVRLIEGKHPLGGPVLAGVGLYVLMIFFVQLLDRFWPGGLEKQSVQSYMAPDDALAQRIFVIITLGLLAPIAEELLFRGVLFQSFCNYLSENTAMVFTSAVFACTHFDFQRFLPLMLGGYLLNLIAVRHHSLLASIISHATWNSLMLIIIYT